MARRPMPEEFMKGKMVPMHIHVPPFIYAWLEQRVRDGSFDSVPETARSILTSVVEDDLHAHGEDFCNIIKFPC